VALPESANCTPRYAIFFYSEQPLLADLPSFKGQPQKNAYLQSSGGQLQLVQSPTRTTQNLLFGAYIAIIYQIWATVLKSLSTLPNYLKLPPL
jgi:hypothetical protein